MKALTELDCQYRPKWHYSAERNWLNDPNGLVYSNGTYHLFYQHNPHGDEWGNMSWGHATSTDLQHWDEQPVAIWCDDQEAIFSGSAVVDVHNTSGFGVGGVPPLVAIYTSAYSPASPLAGRQAQSLAYSTDDGATWTKYAGNPVLDRASPDFRDPKVFWHDGDTGSYWVMVAVEALHHEVVLYKSADLLSWEYLSTFGPANATGGVWECPDLFELPVDGDPSNTRWVMVVNLSPGGIAGGSGGQYFIGTFDGVTFRSETTVTEGVQADDSRMADYGWLDWGRDYYAAVSFSNAPDGRRLMIGWMNNWQYAATTPSDGWRSAMSLVREVRLVSRGGRPVLAQEAVDPFHNHGTELFALDQQPLADGVTWLPAEACGDVLRIDAEFEPGADRQGRSRAPGRQRHRRCIRLQVRARSRGAHCPGIQLPHGGTQPGQDRIRQRGVPRGIPVGRARCRVLGGRPAKAPGVPGPLLRRGLRTGRPGDHHRSGLSYTLRQCRRTAGRRRGRNAGESHRPSLTI